MALKIKAQREKIEFEYEFGDGTKITFNYVEANTSQIEASMELPEEPKAFYEHAKKILKENILGDEALKEKLFADQQENGSMFELKRLLDAEIAQVKQKKSNAS